jgi:hypothetical protein
MLCAIGESKQKFVGNTNKYTMNNNYLFRIVFLALTLFNASFAISQDGGAIFEVGPLMNRARIVPMATTLEDGRVVLFGGREYGFVSCTYADIYDPASNTFTEVTMNNPHDATCAIKLADGKYFVLGGGMNSGIAPGYNVTEIYDPSDDSFTLSTPMTYSRMQHNGTQLADGKILIVGAWYNPSGASTPEIIDLQAGTSTLTGSLNTSRSAPYVFPCDDGNAMIVGGFETYASAYYSSIEEFDHTTNSFTPVSDELIDGETGWLANTYSVNRPSADYRMSDGRYIFLAYRSQPVLEYILVIFNPADKSFTKLETMEPLLGGEADGSIYDFVVDIPNNRAYLLAQAEGALIPELGITGVDLTTGYVQHPTTLFYPPSGEYFYPTLSYMPLNGKILLTGVSSENGTYFSATNQTYLITPDELVGLQESQVAASFDLFPNPAVDHTTISFESAAAGLAEIRIHDESGKLIWSQVRSVFTGKQQWQIDLSGMGSGIYNVGIHLDETNKGARPLTSKLIVR